MHYSEYSKIEVVTDIDLHFMYRCVVRPPDGSLPPENGDVKRNFGGGYLIEGQPLSSPAQRHGQRVCLVFN